VPNGTGGRFGGGRAGAIRDGEEEEVVEAEQFEEVNESEELEDDETEVEKVNRFFVSCEFPLVLSEEVVSISGESTDFSKG